MMGIFGKIFNSKLEITCFSCGFVLTKIPKSKTKCPKCKNFIFVRTNYSDNRKLYLNEKQKNDYDKEKSKFYFEKRWLQELREIGITEKEIEQVRKEKIEKWGKVSFNDLVWAIFNKQVLKYGKGGHSLHDFKMLYFTWALFACEIGSDPVNLQKESHKFDLIEYKRTGFVNQVEILSGHCNNCKKLNGKKFDLDKLLKNNDILPNKECTNKLSNKDKFPWCTCIFLSVIT